MPRHEVNENTLFYGDNLDILRESIPDQSVDLIYLDPPFNSNRNYNVLFRDEHGKEADAQITAFEDTWRWDNAAQATWQALVCNGGAVGELMQALYTVFGPCRMLAYIVMMTARLIELHRVLKPTGSLYLHCDSTASHYLRVVLDTIFGAENFRNEIIWKRTSSHSDAKRFARISDTILYYARSSRAMWNPQHIAHDPAYIKSHYKPDEQGRLYTLGDLTNPRGKKGYFYPLLGCAPPKNGWRMPETRAQEWIAAGRIVIPESGKTARFRRYLDEQKGTVVGNVWTDIPPLNSQAREALGYPTQKPLALLERIIQASTNPGDIVLDPFCGCGTAVAAAQSLGRRWIGIDITHLSIALQKYRMAQMFPDVPFRVVGEPEDVASARQLAQEDRYQFQWWALSLVQARPLGDDGAGHGRKGRDRGVDGLLYFADDATMSPHRIPVQVKSGKVKSSDIRDLVGTIQREHAEMGVFITLEEPTRDMKQEALAAGVYTSAFTREPFPRIQIITIEDLLHGNGPRIPTRLNALPVAPRARAAAPGQATLFSV